MSAPACFSASRLRCAWRSFLAYGSCLYFYSLFGAFYAVVILDVFSGSQTRARVGISIGASIFGVDGETLDHLLIAADEAMYRAKSAHKTGALPATHGAKTCALTPLEWTISGANASSAARSRRI